MKNQIYRVITGSTAYNLDIKGVSDIDEKGVYQPSVAELLSYKEPEKTIIQNNPDIEFHILKKFLDLAMKQNPTILEMMFVSKEHVLFKHDIFDRVLENKEKFITKNIYKSFSGYAGDQLIRIKNSLGGASRSDLEKHAYYVLETLIGSLNERHPEVFKDNNFVKLNNLHLMDSGKYKINVDIQMNDVDFVDMFAALNGISNTVKNFNNRKNRNKKTGEGKLEKHAMHLVRLLLVGTEALKGNGIIVKQEKFRDLLLDIRLSKMSWEDLFKLAEHLFDELEIAYEKTRLPEKIEDGFVDNLYNGIMKEWMMING